MPKEFKLENRSRKNILTWLEYISVKATKKVRVRSKMDFKIWKQAALHETILSCFLSTTSVIASEYLINVNRLRIRVIEAINIEIAVSYGVLMLLLSVELSRW